MTQKYDMQNANEVLAHENENMVITSATHNLAFRICLFLIIAGINNYSLLLA